MAQGSSSRGTRGTQGAGGRRGPPPRSGGNNNSAALGVAVILVVGVVAVIILVSGGNKGPKTPVAPPPTDVQPLPPKVEGPKEPVRGPPPALSPDVIAQAREKVKTFEALAQKGRAVLEEAQAAKAAGTQDLWQEKLAEALEYYSQIREEWNEVIAGMPHNHEWDEEDVMNHYLGKENGQVTKLLEPREGITKSLRPK